MQGKRRIGYCLGFLGFLGLILAAAKWHLDQTFFPPYEPSLPLNVRVLETTERDGFKELRFTFEGLQGESVPAVLALPEGDGPYPCVLYLHELGEEKEQAEILMPRFTEAGYAVSSFDQLTRGERQLSEEDIPKLLLSLRNRSRYTVIEARRIIDYLQTRPDIAGDRIYMVGGSFGAMSSAIVASMDERPKAVVMAHGGANLSKVLSGPEIKRQAGPIYWPARLLIHYFLSVADPAKYVGAISPRPVLFINGKTDIVITLDAANAFFDAANEPKERLLYEGPHIGEDPEEIPMLIEDALAFIERQDSKVTGLSLPEATSASPVHPWQGGRECT